MRLFVTGATGFIGRHVVEAALHLGHEVIALTRHSSPKMVQGFKIPIWKKSDMESLTQLDFEGVEAVIHCAAHTPNTPYDHLVACLRGNVQIPLDMLDHARRAGVRRFIIAGSSFEYGRSAERYDQVPVDAPLEPTATYPASKAAASTLFCAWARVHQIELAVLRIFQVYGPGETPTRLWPSLWRSAQAGEDFDLNPGQVIRDFIRVEQVAAAMVASLDKLDLVCGLPQIHNLGTGKGRTLEDFAREWWWRWGATGEIRIGSIPYRPGEIFHCVAEPSKVFTEASWTEASDCIPTFRFLKSGLSLQD